MPETKLLQTSPKRAFSAISSSSRRSHPSESKSLPRSKRVKIQNSPENTQTTNPETADDSVVPIPSLTSIIPQEKSQESSSDQSASRWFDKANENVGQAGKRSSKHEEESPFFLTRESTVKSPPPVRSTNAESFGHRHRLDDENDDLRGVIDDLTIENKKLKYLVRSLQSRSASGSPSKDKVLEIRMHGLPTGKKRELEHLLKTFTLGLGDDSPSQPTSSTALYANPTSPGRGSSKRRTLGLPNDASAEDSGYASISASGGNSNSQLASSTPRERIQHNKQDKEIKDYLHDIPSFLLPHEPLTISDNAKMVLVVQKLEQLFTGKLATPGEHSQPIQQQKISHSAARQDRREDMKHNRTTKTEGSREAQMLPQDTKMNLDQVDADQGQANKTTDDSSETTPDHPDQRPTRPLDLDIHRAQVAEENVRYMHHLGIFPPDSNQSSKSQPWIYLNLLISMAQLHTLNVTPSFVRRAIKEHSNKFELSKDQHKVRFKGGTETPAWCRLLEHADNSVGQSSEDGIDETGRRSGRSATSTGNDLTPSMSTSEGRQGTNTTQQVPKSASASTNIETAQTSAKSKSSSFDYKPIVYQRKGPFAQPSYLDSGSSGSISPESSDAQQAKNWPHHKHKHKSNHSPREGLVTFFSNPYYCVDLSGDQSFADIHPVEVDSRKIIGASEPIDLQEFQRDLNACYFFRQSKDIEPEWGSDCDDLELSLDPITFSGEDETQPIELPASGIGGVCPAENFAIDVKVIRSAIAKPNRATKETPVVTRRGGLRQQQPHFGYEVGSRVQLALQPSKLPPPSYGFFTSSSDASGMSWRNGGDSGDSSDSESTSPDESPIPADLLWQWTSSSTDKEGGDQDESEASLSLHDFQAARVRLDDPSGEAAHHPEYSVTQTSRAVSGSLAATVGASWSAASVADPEDEE
ncbi:hypothetical protein B0A52_00744 [Exophiala mesophila]|uniref:Frequency clock protein n=1 Tax=Exophiala mesophila TaxID=212818 RepID=A0A438NI37_EXOME|nr:hypothetical protein B0A52_00744 [Exophiala mesophila]